MVSRTRFENAVLPHMKAAFNLAYWIMHSREEAEDVVQDAYVRAFAAFAETHVHAIKPWLLTIVRNVAYRALQNRKRYGNVVQLAGDLGHDLQDLQELPASEPSPELQLIAASERQRLFDALAMLPVAQREVIVLRELEGQSYAEIAHVTGVPIGTVMSRLALARAGLRNALRLSAQDDADAV
jgi:RNA polymerase sigma factor (sigma-70 family)